MKSAERSVASKIKCAHCGIDTINPKYCSNSCQGKYESNKGKEKFEKEGINPSNPRTIKKYLTEIKGYYCEICLISIWQEKLLVLILDHIDGNSENQNVGNLRLLCPNCDSQTPTYKSKNLGKGRHYRRQRYLEGKSY